MSAEPTSYAATRLPWVRARWTPDAAATTARIAAVVFPGAPPEALAGMWTDSYPGGDQDDTTAAGFHEVGLFQTPAGDDTSRPAPQPGSSWWTIATNPLTLQLLGRPASTEPDGWRGAVPDQTAVGLQDLRAGAEGVQLAARGPASWGSCWALALSFAAFTAGPAGASRALARYASSPPDSGRWWRVVREVLADPASGARVPGSPYSAARIALRTSQKLAAGLALAVALGRPTSWWEWPQDLDEAALVAAAAGASSSRRLGAAEARGGSGGALAAGGLAAALVAAHRLRRRKG